MPPETPSARTVARRLVLRDAPGREDRETTPASVVAACARAYEDLERWFGSAGCNALFARALAQARATQPALKGIGLRESPVLEFEHVEPGVEAFGAVAVALALEEVLVALVALLGRMIGEDMAERLLVTPPAFGAIDAVPAPAPVSDHVPAPRDDASPPLDAPVD